MDKKLSISIYHQIGLWWYAGAFPLRPRPANPRGPSFSADQRVSVSSLTAILSYHFFIFSVASASLSPQFGNAVYQVKHGSVKITKTTGGLSGMLSCSSTLVDVQLMCLRKVLYLRTAELPDSPHIITLFVSLYFIIRVYNIIYFCFTNNMKDYKLFTVVKSSFED